MRLLLPLLFSAVTAFAADSLPANAIPKDAVLSPVTTFKLSPDAFSRPPQGFVEAKTADGDRLLLLQQAPMDHGDLSVKLKALSDEGEQVGGIVFRYVDPKNFCVIRANSRDDTCEYVRVKNGKEKTMDSKNVIVSPLTWHELHITFTPDSYTGLIDGDAIIGDKESHLKTPGQAGLWLKAGAQVIFSDLHVSQ